MPKRFWLVKQEPGDYAWDAFVRDGKTAWTGVRNFQARNFLRAMSAGDPVLYYHSGEGREVVGIAKVGKAAYADPTATEGDWSCVDLVPVKALKKPVPLATLKSDPATAKMLFVRQSRLSVSEVTEAEYARILELGS